MITRKGALTIIHDEDGPRLAFSYDTCLYVRRDGRAVINATKYSSTTSKHQSLVKGEVVIMGAIPGVDVWTELEGLPRNTSEEDLLKAAFG